MLKKLYVITLLMALFGQTTLAGTGLRERYTIDNPLIYEDGWEKWPYSFINSDNEADGFNVELVTEMMRRLGIPFEVRLRDQQQVHQDLKRQAAHLSMGVAAPYNSSYSKFGSVTLCLFENSLMVPRSDSVPFIKVSTMHHIPLLVQENSRAHKYLIQQGYKDSLILSDQHMVMAVLDMVNEGRGGALWNTMSLKWIMRKYNIRDYVLIPTDIPPGEYRFMSSDTELLHALDSVSIIMQQEGEIDRIINHWMYPERKTYQIPYITIAFVISASVALVLLIMFIVRYYRTYYSHSTLDDVNSQMGLILGSYQISVWVYDAITEKYAWMTPDGKIEQEYNTFEFSQFFPDKQFSMLHTQVEDIVANPGKAVTTMLRAYNRSEEKEVIDVETRMTSVIDDYGKVYLVCGVQHNITDSKAYMERMRVLHERYKTAFNIALGGIVRFDAKGRVIDINHRLCVKLGIKDVNEVLCKGYTIHDFGIFNEIDIDKDFTHELSFCAQIRNEEMVNYMPFAHIGTFNPDFNFYNEIPTDKQRADSSFAIREKGYYHLQLTKSFDDDGTLISYIFYLKDITEEIYRIKRLKKKEQQLERIRRESEDYRRHRDHMLVESDIVMLRYYPEAKRLFFFDQNKNRMVPVTQLRVIEMMENDDMKSVYRAFYRADTLKDQEFHLNVRTLLRNSKGEKAQMEVHMCPFKDNNGNVIYYFGVCHDVTSHVTINNVLKQETQRFRESSRARHSFIKDMTYSVRQPLVAMQQNISSLISKQDDSNNQNIAERQMVMHDVKRTAQRLIKLSDDTYLLSRIEAGMYIPDNKVQDFVPIFRTSVEEALKPYRVGSVEYNIQSTYNSLMLCFDSRIIGRILREAVALSARYTDYGTVNIHYFYHNSTISIAIDDNGQGVPPDMQKNIFAPRMDESLRSADNITALSGLEMPLCHAMVKMLGGTIDIESRTGRGTTTYIQIPMIT